MIQKFETAFRRLRRWMSRTEWAIRILGLPRDTRKRSAEPGLIMIQIDGLSRKEFDRAVASGRMPFLKSLIEREHYHTHDWYSGLPSSTPAVQGELFYGVRSAVPAFQYVDRDSGEFRVMFDQEAAAQIEAQLAEQVEGLLTGGSSYSNIYTGGAEESHFCAASMGWANFMRLNSNPLRILLLALINFASLLRIVGLMTLETVLAVVDAFRGIIARHDLVKEIRFVPVRVGICIMLRELIGISVRMDIARGLPVIHANLLGYDEQAHRRGPDSLFAHWTLSGIDGAIARIASQAKRSELRHYDLWVYSDHGQEKVTSFEKTTGTSLEKTINDAFRKIGSGMQAKKATPATHHRTTRGRKQLLFHQERAETREEDAATANHELKIAGMGPVGHIYCKERLSDQEKSLLALELTRHGGIPMALFINSRNELMASDEKDQCRVLADHSESFLGADHPFLHEIVEDLRGLCAHPDAGQVVISGYRAGEQPVSFPLENGSHAGASPNETHGFALLPDDTALPTHEKDHIRPIDLRHAALHFLGKQQIVEPFYIKSDRSERGKQTLRVMTYNVHQCLGMDGKHSPLRIARVIAQYAPDIVALQELDVGRARSAHEDQAHLIAEHLEMEFHFHPAIHLEEERYGDAILTHYPMELVKAAILPTMEGVDHLEPRGAIWTRITVGDQQFNVLNTHLGLRTEERRLQVEALLGDEWLGHPDCNGHVILCGDFNLPASSKTFKKLTNVLNDAQTADPAQRPISTFCSRVPVARIDHILLDPDGEVTSCSVPSTSLTRVASDHLPLIADIYTGPRRRP